MIVDSSALIAILKGEPESADFSRVLEATRHSSMSAATYLEACVVIERLGIPTMRRHFEDAIQQSRIAIEPFTFEQATVASQAYRDYGKGSGHPAKLNFGDCFTYALARVKREPVLFKGDDFNHTDLRSALEVR